MSDQTETTLEAVRGGLDELLAAIPANLPANVVAKKSCDVLIQQLNSNPPTENEMILTGFLATAIARLKESEVP